MYKKLSQTNDNLFNNEYAVDYTHHAFAIDANSKHNGKEKSIHKSGYTKMSSQQDSYLYNTNTTNTYFSNIWRWVRNFLRLKGSANSAREYINFSTNELDPDRPDNTSTIRQRDKNLLIKSVFNINQVFLGEKTIWFI